MPKTTSLMLVGCLIVLSSNFFSCAPRRQATVSETLEQKQNSNKSVRRQIFEKHVARVVKGSAIAMTFMALNVVAMEPVDESYEKLRRFAESEPVELDFGKNSHLISSSDIRNLIHQLTDSDTNSTFNRSQNLKISDDYRKVTDSDLLTSVLPTPVMTSKLIQNKDQAFYELRLRDKSLIEIEMLYDALLEEKSSKTLKDRFSLKTPSRLLSAKVTYKKTKVSLTQTYYIHFFTNPSQDTFIAGFQIDNLSDIDIDKFKSIDDFEFSFYTEVSLEQIKRFIENPKTSAHFLMPSLLNKKFEKDKKPWVNAVLSNNERVVDARRDFLGKASFSMGIAVLGTYLYGLLADQFISKSEKEKLHRSVVKKHLQGPLIKGVGTAAVLFLATQSMGSLLKASGQNDYKANEYINTKPVYIKDLIPPNPMDEDPESYIERILEVNQPLKDFEIRERLELIKDSDLHYTDYLRTTIAYEEVEIAKSFTLQSPTSENGISFKLTYNAALEDYFLSYKELFSADRPRLLLLGEFWDLREDYSPSGKFAMFAMPNTKNILVSYSFDDRVSYPRYDKSFETIMNEHTDAYTEVSVSQFDSFLKSPKENKGFLATSVIANTASRREARRDNKFNRLDLKAKAQNVGAFLAGFAGVYFAGILQEQAVFKKRVSKKTDF